MPLKVYEARDPGNVRFSAVDATIDELLAEFEDSVTVLEVFKEKIDTALHVARIKWGIKETEDYRNAAGADYNDGYLNAEGK